jgi:hypothetical protein
MRNRTLSVFLLILILGHGRGEAQSPDSAERKQVVASRVAAGAVRIDGRLDEEIWLTAAPVTDFVQAEPNEGVAPTDPLEVRIVFDEDALIVGARMFSADPASIQSPMSRRDEGIDQAEHILVSLDTYMDRRTAYTFGVTAAGVRFDHFHASDNRYSRDRSFDPVWEARVAPDARGWTAELRIPFHQLRFNAGAEQVFGINIYRAIPSKNEQVYWSLVRRTDRVWASRFGELRGVAGLSPSRRIELLPYTAASSKVGGDVDDRDPFSGSDTQARVGGDVKVGLGPNLTVEATVNPDFGQVEADPAEVNLSAFETFFSERRPFFLEGSRLLGAAGEGNNWDGGGGGGGNSPQYFYSRRIGASPPGDADGDFVDYPATTTILGAAKITGRLASGTSVGILGAMTTEEVARTFVVSNNLFGEQRVAPRTLYGVGRVQQEFGPAGSTAAFMMTMAKRDLSSGDPLGAFAARNAFTASGESLLRFRDGEYEVGMNLGMSRVTGDEAGIERLQRSSARYFHRPDVSYVSFDPNRSALTGLKGGLSAERTSGRHWLWQVTTDFISPGFEINDLGRLNVADRISGVTQLEYRETEPGRIFRNYTLGIEHERDWNFGGALQASSVEGEAEVTWPNFWETQVSFGIDEAAEDDRLTRGGPTMGTPRGWSSSFMLRNSDAARTRANLRLELEGNEDGGSGMELSADLTFRPATRWQLTLSPVIEREINERQYVSTLEQGPAATFGRRYVFAFVDRTTLSSEIRLNYAFKPDVNLEFYGEPFAASGRYYDFAQLAAPGSRLRLPLTTVEGSPSASSVALTDGTSNFTLRNRDFNVLSFRSNLVLRWEWRPGSTLYLVWQQDREESEISRARVGFRDIFGSFGAAGHNVLAVKTTFWLGGL